MGSLFGKEFDIVIKQPKVKDIIEKIDSAEELDQTTLKVLKSKKLTLEERLAFIKDKVLRVLKKQKDRVIVIKDKETFEKYISKAIEVGRIAVDTETNNSLDPVTCKLMGLCLYVPGEKQAYIPVNHRDHITKERLSWQLTEADCKEQLSRLSAHRGGWIPDYEGQSYYEWYQQHVEILFKDKDPVIIMHNGKFDYEVLKCTCGVEVIPDWDTIIAARLINENEEAGLKAQYIAHIDAGQEKYDIEKLFEDVQYADVDPYIFALYAAHDAGMTDKLYEWQYNLLYNSFIYDIINLDSADNNFEVYKLTQLETTSGYIAACDLKVGDIIKTDTNLLKINNLVNNFNKIIIFYSLN